MMINFSIFPPRSQVVREVCVTVAYISQEFRHKVAHLAESVLPHLISLIQNGAKVRNTDSRKIYRGNTEKSGIPRQYQ